MIQLACPHCGPRNAAEFRYIGERRARPPVDGSAPAVWRDYLYIRDNPAGWVREAWLHRAGCRRYLLVERHTVTNEVRSVTEASGGASTVDLR